MKFVLAQINPRVGDLQGNGKKIIEAIKKAVHQNAEAVFFPELALTGYPPRDLLFGEGFIEKQEPILKEICALSSNLLIGVGHVERNTTQIGKPFFNAVSIYGDQKLLGRARKILLPNYDVFSEERYFEPGENTLTLQWKGKKIGLTICEDIWNHFPGMTPIQYRRDPVKELVKEGNLDLLVNCSASPFHLGKIEQRLELLSNLAKELKTKVACINQVGGNDDLLFDGSSAIFNTDGKLLNRAASFQEDGIDSETTAQKELPTTIMQLSDALEMGIRDFFSKTGNQKALIGLSGGIDSTIVAVLLVRALGKENVLGVSLPSKFNSESTKSDARELANRLGVGFRELPIQGVIEKTLELLKPEKGLTAENIQPRIRMMALMAIANEENRLLVNTSNKSELTCGYATLYGDTAGALGVLGDLTKHQVYELGRYFNTEKEVIPESLFTRPPSAELRPDQKDEDSLPPYKDLDRWVVEKVEQEISDAHFKDANFLNRYHQSEYKRHQFPPILRVSPKAFGQGRLYPIAAKAT